MKILKLNLGKIQIEKQIYIYILTGHEKQEKKILSGLSQDEVWGNWKLVPMKQRVSHKVIVLKEESNKLSKIDVFIGYKIIQIKIKKKISVEKKRENGKRNCRRN